MNRLGLIAGVVLLIVVLVFLNQGIRKATPTDEDLQRQAQEQAQKQTPAAMPKPPASGAPAGASVALPPDETVGDPAKARHHIQIGWSYDEANQKNPAMLTGPIEAVKDYVKKSGGATSAEIVNLDVPPADRAPAARAVTTPGVVVDGRTIVTGSFSEMHAAPQDIARMLNQAVGAK